MAVVPLSAVATSNRYFMAADLDGETSSPGFNDVLDPDNALNNNVYTCQETGYHVFAARWA